MAPKSQKMDMSYFEHHAPEKKYTLDDFDDGKVSAEDMQRYAMLGFALSVVVWHRGLNNEKIQKGEAVRGAKVSLDFVMTPNEGFEALRKQQESEVMCCINWLLMPAESDKKIEDYAFALGTHQEC